MKLVQLFIATKISIQKPPQLNEEEDQASYYRYVQNDLYNWVQYPKLSKLSNIANYSLGYSLDPKLIGEIFKQHKTKILTVLKEYVELQTSGEPDYANLMDWLLIMIRLYTAGCNWPELIAMLTAEKPTVIRTILMLVKETNDFWLASKTINDLRQIGINWPEFDIIMKSISHIMANKKANLNENDGNDIFNNEKFVQQIIDKFDYMFENNGPLTAIRYIGEYVGQPIPAIIDHINTKKYKIMKYLLQNTTLYANYVIVGICYLKEIGLTWPEFDIIEKSLEAEKKTTAQVRESRNTNRAVIYAKANMLMALQQNVMNAIVWFGSFKQYQMSDEDIAVFLDEHKQEFMDYLNRFFDNIKSIQVSVRDSGRLNLFLITLSELTKFVHWPELTQFVNDNKTTIMKLLLYKFTLSLSIGQIDTVLNVLENDLKVNWPELNIIHQSLQHIKDSNNAR